MATLSGVSAAYRRTASPRDCIDDVAELMIDASTVFPSPLSLERPLLSPHVEATANDAIGRMVTIGYSKLNWRSKWRPASQQCRTCIFSSWWRLDTCWL